MIFIIPPHVPKIKNIGVRTQRKIKLMDELSTPIEEKVSFHDPPASFLLVSK
jgi:hypothetical protein